MAFQNKVINGTDIILSVNGQAIACATSHSIELTNAVREISCNSTGDFTSAAYGRFSWTVSTDALLNLDDTTYITYAELMALMLAKTEVTISSLYTQSAGNTLTLSGTAILTSISKTAGDNENASYSVSMQGVGALSSVAAEN